MADNIETPISYRPELPDWGVFMRWPTEGTDWIHPSDISTAESLIPSPRVFRRSVWDGTFYRLHYGEHELRVRPTLWVSAPAVDLEVGQQVEVLSHQGKNDAGVFRVQEIYMSTSDTAIEFYLSRGEMRIARSFTRKDLRPIYVKHHLRSGFFQHAPPKRAASASDDALDVGDLLDE